MIPSAALLIAWPSYTTGFLASTRDMQRIESTSTSPLYSSFQSALMGLTTIRAFAAERHHLEDLYTMVDVNQALWWAVCTIEVWLR